MKAMTGALAPTVGLNGHHSSRRADATGAGSGRVMGCLDGGGNSKQQRGEVRNIFLDYHSPQLRPDTL